MNKTILSQVTWLEGHSLAQTVFTNLYLHNPYVIEDRCLKAFCICTLKTVDHIRDRVNRASVFEEVWTFLHLILKTLNRLQWMWKLTAALFVWNAF